MASKKTFLLRLSQDMWQELEAWAADEFRSVNGQIEYLLKLAMNKRKGKPFSKNDRKADDSEK